MSKLKKNLVYQFTYQILAVLLPFITSPYVSRILGAEGIGKYSYSCTMAYYFYITAMLGFDTYGQRLIASNQNNKKNRSKVFTELIILQIVITLVVSIVYMLYIVSQSGEKRLLAELQYIYIASAFTNIIWLFEGVEEFRNVAIRNIFVKLFSYILIILCVKTSSDLWKYTLIMAASTFIGNIVFLFYAKKYVSFIKPEFKAIIKNLKPIFLLFVPQLGIATFMQMDKLMIDWWSTERQLGYYQNAEKIINIPVTLILTVGTVFMPRIVSLKIKGDRKQIKYYNSLIMELFLLMGVGCMFGLIAIADDFTPWFFGNDFIESTSILAMLSAQIVFMAWENVLQKQYLIPFGRDKVVVITMVGAAIINLILNAILIPQYAANGAIIGSLAAHFAICIYEGVLLRRDLPIKEYILKGLSFLIPGMTMCLVVLLFAKVVKIPILTIKVIFEIVLGVIIYLVLCMGILRMKKSILYNLVIEYLKKIK